MASHTPRRRSMEDPPGISDVIRLKDDLNRLHEETSGECQTRIKKISKQVNEFEEYYKNFNKGAAIAGATGVALAITGGILALFTMGASLIIAGLGAATAIAGGATAGVKKFKEGKLKQTIQTELDELQKKMSPMINLLEKIFQRTQEILRNPTIPQRKVTAIRHLFNYCFQKCTTFNLSGNLSRTLAEIGKMLELLDEILEDDQDESAKPKTKEEFKKKEEEFKKKEEEFKKKAEKFINEMREGINQLQNTMNAINNLKERISKSLNDNY